ncbi:hypothetical protein MTO96_029800 [Rhipicephalus appendiculatus]
METFTYSCEQRTSAIVKTRLDVTKANVVWRSKPEPSFNVHTLADVVDRKLDLRCVQQAILSLEANSRAESLLEEAASQPHFWKNITRLTFVLTAPKRTELADFPDRALAFHGNRMGQFFKMCFSQITELNLCSSHFATGIQLLCPPGADVASPAVAGTNSVRSQPHAWSLESLALGCNLLEDLVIRSNLFGDVIPSCEACQFPLRFTCSSLGLLQMKTRLRRLSIDEQAKVLDLTFLIVCRVEAASTRRGQCGRRGPSAVPVHSSASFSQANPRLTSLTLVASRATLSDGVARTFTKITELAPPCRAHHDLMRRTLVWMTSY